MASFIGGNPQPPYTGGRYPAPVPTTNAYAPPTAGNAGDATDSSDRYTSTSYLDYPTPTAPPLNLDTAFDNFLAQTRDEGEDSPPVTPTASVTPAVTATATPVVYTEATPTVYATPTATATASPTAYGEVTPTANSGYSERYYMPTPTVANGHYGTHQATYAQPTPTAYSSRRRNNNPPQQIPPVKPPIVYQRKQPDPPVIQQPPVVHEYRQPDPPPVVRRQPPIVDNQSPPRRPKNQDVPRQPVPQQLTPAERLMLTSNPNPVRLPDGTTDDSQNGFNLVPPNVSASLLNPAAIQALGNPFLGSTGGSPVPHGGGGGGKNWTQDLYSGILDNYFGGQQPSSDGITETAGLQFTSGF